MTHIFTPTDVIDLESLDIRIIDNSTDTAIVAIGRDASRLGYYEVIITRHTDHYLCDCDTYQSKQSLLESLYAEHLVLEASSC
jgi:hypothetical protein